MSNKINELKNKGGIWFSKKAHGGAAKFWLAVLAFTESSFFLIPPDVLLIAIILAGARRWARYALFTAAFSVLGAIFGYIIGVFFFDLVGERIIDLYNLQEEFQSVKVFFDNSAFWMMFFASFTPIPYKVFVLTGGFLKADLFAFVAASVIGRSMRFLLVAYVVKLFKPGITRIIFKYFNIITYAVAALFILWMLFEFGIIPF